MGFIPSANAQTKTFTVGVLGPMSGSSAIWGLNLEHGLAIAIEEINEAGGITVKGERYLVKYIVGDHQARSADATILANKMIFKDNIKYIVGNCVGATCGGAQSVTEPNHVVFLHQCWGTKSIGPDKPYSFRTLVSQWEVAPQLYGWFHKKYPKITSLAIMSPNDTSGWDTTEAVKYAAEAYGLKIVVNEFYKRGSTDYYPILSKIMATKPEIIDLSGSAPGDGGLILKQLNELGYNGVKIWTAGDPPDNWIEISGKKSGEGVYLGLAPNFEGAKAAVGLKNFARKYHAKKYKEGISIQSVVNYTGMKALAQAIEQAGTFDQDKVINVLENSKYQTAFGRTVVGGKKKYGINRQFIWPVTISQVRDGKGVDVFRAAEVIAE